MSNVLLTSVTEHFAELDDPRRPTKNQRHDFTDILVIALCAVIGGANYWTTVATFGQAKFDWFSRFLRLHNGIPSHDTFSDVFAKIDAERFESCFIAWVQALAVMLPGVSTVAIDGKTLRRSHDRANGMMPTHIVSALASANALVLGQLSTDVKSNEITAIPALLEMLSLEGALVTIDALGCQTKIASKIREKGADYLLAVKENQPSLCENIGDAFLDPDKERFAQRFADHAETDNKGHGRVERRRCWTCEDHELIEPLSKHWIGLKRIVVIETERTVGDKPTTHDRHWFISSREESAQYFLAAKREHWQIENGLHWVLDVAFREDESRVRKGDGAENLSVLRRMALNLLKQEKTHKGGIEAKRCRAGWDERYMELVLSKLGAV